jgi:hypothetical protein
VKERCETPIVVVEMALDQMRREQSQEYPSTSSAPPMVHLSPQPRVLPNVSHPSSSAGWPRCGKG